MYIIVSKYYCKSVLRLRLLMSINIDLFTKKLVLGQTEIYIIAPFPLFSNHFPLRSFNQKHVFYFFFWIVTWNYDDSPSKKSSNIKTWIRWMLPRCLFPNSWRFRLFFPVTVISHKQHLKHCWYFHYWSKIGRYSDIR